MSTRKSPLQAVKERFGSKEELVHKLLDFVEPRDEESKDELSARLKHVANKKLLHLAEIGEKVKSLGGKDKLVEKIAELRGHIGDNDYVKKLKGFSLSKLLDTYESLRRKKTA